MPDHHGQWRKRRGHPVPSSARSPSRPAKAYAVLVDELNAGELQSGSKRRFVRGSHGNFPLNSFYPTIAATPTFETWADRERSTVDEAIPADPKSRILDRRSSPQ
jgi:hypothetical protein